MSFNSSRRSAGKGASPKKRSAKKKQGFHTAKRRPRQPEELDIEKVKERTSSGLEHLGRQTFSVDRGSYGMEGWVKSLNLLLEDFESKIGPDQLPESYAAQKEAIIRGLSTPVNTTELEAKVEAIRAEEAEIKMKLEREKERISARLVEMRNERDRKSKELENEKSSLERLIQERKSVSFLSKLAGRRGPSTKPLEDKIDGLKSTLLALEQEEKSLNTAWNSIQKRGTDSPDPYAADWRRLNDIGNQIDVLRKDLEERLQRAEERNGAAESLVRLISIVKPPAAEEQ